MAQHHHGSVCTRAAHGAALETERCRQQRDSVVPCASLCMRARMQACSRRASSADAGPARARHSRGSAGSPRRAGAPARPRP